MCLYPRLINNPKYKENKKNGGNIPIPRDPRTIFLPVPCGHCMECHRKKKNEWKIRLTEEIKDNKNGLFVTLTFSNESIKELTEEIWANEIIEGYNLDNTISTIATRRYLERERKATGKSKRHWLITEIGHNGTENIHLHGIIWNTEKWDINALITTTERWQYGYIYPRNERELKKAYTTGRTINYISKYINKRDIEHKEYEPIILTSSGIGAGYIENKRWSTKDFYITESGHKMGMPQYYRNKLLTEEQKEIEWIKKLDENTRYVNKKKIKIDKKYDEYIKAVQYERIKNVELGYKNSYTDIEQKEYENKIRIIKQMERMKIKK